MQLKYAVKGLAVSMRVKEKMRRTGKTFNGHKLWTKEEDEKVARLYPDYKTLRCVLKHRSFSAIKARACTLKITKKRHCWTELEVSKLRKLYPKATHQEILLAFPGLRWEQIVSRAGYANIMRARKPYKPTGFTVLDDIRSYSFKHNINMVELDAMARTKKYFQKAQWHAHGFASSRAASRAIVALGGQVRADW